jgi:membrane protein
MPGRRSLPSDNWLWIAATTILILTAQRYFQANALRKPAPQPANSAVAGRGNLAREVSPSGHGRPASNPLQIPWAGWKDILRRTHVRSGEDRLLAIAAGMVFFGLLAIFPATTALVSCYGLFANPSTIGDNLQTLAPMMPEDSFQIVQDQIARVLDKGVTALGATFLFGLALAIWSANAGFRIADVDVDVGDHRAVRRRTEFPKSNTRLRWIRPLGGQSRSAGVTLPRPTR